MSGFSKDEVIRKPEYSGNGKVSIISKHKDSD